MLAKMPAPSTVTRMVRELTHDAALSVAHAALDEARQSGLKVCVAVVDRGGNLLVMLRDAGAPPHCLSLAEDKAYTCASFGFPSAAWHDILGHAPSLARSLPPRPRWALIGGGLPIHTEEELVGGIGVSGGSEEQDAQCAQAGLSCLGLMQATKVQPTQGSILLKTYSNTINGQPVGSDKAFESINPATGESIGRVPISSKQQVAEAIAAARAAQPAWAAKPDAERKALMMKVAEAIKGNANYLADWVTREQGKPLGGVGPDQVPGARFELWGCEVWTQVPASLDLPIEVAFEDETRRDEVHRKPFGVVAAIAPWNWPLLIAIWQIIPSIRAGNTVVIKPSEYTSIGTLELVRVVSEILPPGVVNTVSGPGEVGSWLVSDPGIDKVMFTGSGPTGAKIAQAAAKNLVPVALELGGNDAAILLPDADPKAMAMGLFWGAFINMGQTCACAKRLYVPENLFEPTVQALKELAEMMPMGDGLQEGMVMGPIQNKMQYDKVVSLVESAKAQGGTIVCGGAPKDGAGYFYPLTLVTGLKDGDRLVDEEQFGPVLPIIKYRDVEEAIASANRLDVGLGASVWSTDVEKAKQVASRIQAGTVWINQHGMIHPMVPFGGVKGSGYGVEFGLDGLKAVTQPQVISIKK